MSNAFTNFLNGFVGGVIGQSGNLRDYQHASRLYVDNYFELTPKAGWIYYVVLNINPQLRQSINPARLAEFEMWYTRYGGRVGLLAKQADLPKFTIETETVNQYNRKVVIQKKINYDSVSITFHDDMANATTNLWKQYYQYYFADGVSSSQFLLSPQIIPKYKDNKFSSNDSDAGSLNYGLNNGQYDKFFTSIDLYELHRHRYTKFTLVNPIVKKWDHDPLDQTQGNKMMSSKMTVDYESVMYDTSAYNRTNLYNPGFAIDHYDNTPSPISVSGQGSASLFGEGGVMAGAVDILGDLQHLDQASPLDLLNTVIKGANVVRNAKSLSKAGIKQEGYSMLTGTLSNIAASPAAVQNLDGTISRVPASDRISQGFSQTLNGVSQNIAPAGINLFTGRNSSVTDTVYATPNRLNF